MPHANDNDNNRYNEQKRLAERYVKFNLQELMKIAVNFCEGATNCKLW